MVEMKFVDVFPFLPTPWFSLQPLVAYINKPTAPVASAGYHINIAVKRMARRDVDGGTTRERFGGGRSLGLL
jgi:hypothetical protein